MSTTVTTTTTGPLPSAELTVVERAAVLRCCRETRDNLKTTVEHLRNQHKLGDRHADAASRVIDAELSILEAAIRKMWRQSGADSPPGE